MVAAQRGRGRLRIGLALALLATSLAAQPALAADRVILFADRDDDDTNGIPDAEQPVVPLSAELFSLPLSISSSPAAPPARLAKAKAVPAGAVPKLRGTAVRLLADGRALAPDAPIPAHVKRLDVQALRAGRAEIDLLGKTYSFGAVELRAFDGDGAPVDLTRSHASLQRTPPDRLADDPFAPTGDPDALRFVVMGHADDVPTTLTIFSYSAENTPIDALAELPLAHVPCPAGADPSLTCGSTLPIRAVADDIDRSHPLIASRSIRAELGGALAVVSSHGDKIQMIRVAGPRKAEEGAIERYRAKIRVFLVRHTPHGPPPMGGDDAGAIEVARAEVGRANALWAACGVSFGPLSELEIAVVDPPRPHMLAVGCDQGLPASGGSIHARVDGRDLAVKLSPGMRPRAAARVIAAAIGALGFTARVSDNAVIGAGAFGSSDVLVRRRDGSLAAIEPPASGPVSSDATLSACIGRVDPEDGLTHFGDVDAIAGTVEERALVKAFDDGDPATVEVFMVASFAGGGRIGESFISADGGAIRNVLIEDRAGVRADRASFALAHELGHILLDDPGHPDDFGIDTPTRLMDADAANASAYGPRRLLVSECSRALRQSGPSAPIALLRAWPLGPLGRGAAPGPRSTRSVSARRADRLDGR